MKPTLAALTLGLSLAALARATPDPDPLPPEPQDLRAEEPDVELVLRTRLEEAARAARWPEVVAAFQELRRRGLAGDDRRLLLHYAQAQVARRDGQAAEAALAEVLRGRPDDVVALPLLARVRAEGGRLKDAGDLLVLAARSGRLVLADLRAEPDGGALRPLLRDPRFILRVMTASRGEEPARGPRHDPFVSALLVEAPPGGGGPAPDAEDEARAALRRELAALLERVLALAEAQDMVGVERAFRDLRALLARCEGRLAHEELEAARARFEGARELYDALRLQVLVHEGNRHLRAAGRAMDEGRWSAALEAAAGIEATAGLLREGGRALWLRNAEAFELRARDITRRARLERDIALLRLDVTGIVLPPPGEAPRKAIINDRVHAEGAEVVDAAGETIEGLRLVGITASAVRFRFQEREFVRPLKPRL